MIDSNFVRPTFEAVEVGSRHHVAQVIAFHPDRGASESSLSSRVVSGSGGGDILPVKWVEALLEAGNLPIDMDIGALRP